MTDNDYAQIRLKAQQLEKSKKGYLAYLCNTFNCDRITAKKIFDQLVNNEPLAYNLQNIEDEPNNDATTPEADNRDDLIFGSGYTYNQRTDKYIVQLRTYGGNYVCPGDQHRAMLTAYSNWNGNERSIQKIASDYKMRREWVVEYFKIMKWTHDTVPITDEEIKLGRSKEAKERILDTKKTNFQQELQKEDWKQTQLYAREWIEFQSGKLDVIDRVLSGFKAKSVTPIKYTGSKNTNDEVLLIGLSDVHFGSKASASELFSGEDFNSDKLKAIMTSYFNKIQEEVNNRKNTFKEVVVCSLGDILHGLSGYTVKGTPLESDVLREEQFELALNTLITFFSNLLHLFKQVKVYAVKGNHAGVGDYILFKAIEMYFNNENRIKFTLFKSRQGCFKIDNTAILMDHGASDFAKSIMPTSGAPKEAYVQALFMEHPDILTGARSKLMLTGDRHRFLQEELRGFEHVTFGSCTTGDRYADNLGLHSRARQNCLVLNKDGVKEAISFYFD